MKKRVVSVLLAASLIISALTLCGANSEKSERAGGTRSGQSGAYPSSAPAGESSGGTTDSVSSGTSDDGSGTGRRSGDASSRGSRTEAGESAGQEGGATQESGDAVRIAREAFDRIIAQKNTVIYSYMNTITCMVDGTEVSAETANQVTAYGAKDSTGNILTVNKESGLRRDGNVLVQRRFWYDQGGNVYSSGYDETSGSFSPWRLEDNYGTGMTWMNETGLEVYQAIIEEKIRPKVLESPDGKKHILYFVLSGSQTQSLFGRLFDDVTFNSIPVSASAAERVEVQVIVTRESYQPYALRIKASDFNCGDETNVVNVLDYDISLAYTNWSSEPLAIPEDVRSEAADQNQVP